jgi:hypothetical protein
MYNTCIIKGGCNSGVNIRSHTDLQCVRPEMNKLASEHAVHTHENMHVCELTVAERESESECAYYLIVWNVCPVFMFALSLIFHILMLCSKRIFPLAGLRSEFKLLCPSKCEPKHSLSPHRSSFSPHHAAPAFTQTKFFCFYTLVE